MELADSEQDGVPGGYASMTIFRTETGEVCGTSPRPTRAQARSAVILEGTLRTRILPARPHPLHNRYSEWPPGAI